MDELFFLLAATNTLGHRLAVFLFATIVGGVLIFIGRHEIRTKISKESLKGTLVNTILGRPSTYQGQKAVRLGWTHVIFGIAMIVFGVLFLVVGSIVGT